MLPYWEIVTLLSGDKVILEFGETYNPITSTLIKRGKIKHRPITACEDGGRDWCDMSASQEHQGMLATTKGLEGSSPTAFRDSVALLT